MQSQPINMLVVDDDDVSHMLNMQAAQKVGDRVQLVTASDGIDALEVLRSTSENRRLSEPFVILLDLRMPRMNGLEFLQEVRRDPKLRHIVVFILSTSAQERDIQQAFALNAAGYFVKPHAFPELEAMFKTLVDYCQLSRLPSSSNVPRLQLT